MDATQDFVKDPVGAYKEAAQATLNATQDAAAAFTEGTTEAFLQQDAAPADATEAASDAVDAAQDVIENPAAAAAEVVDAT